MPHIRTVAVIGAGQLGSRHLQALSLMDVPVVIEVLDPVATSLDIAKARFEQASRNEHIRGIRFLTSMEDLSRHIDVAVVATNADVRADVVHALLSHAQVRNLLLEKVLFQRVHEYAAIQVLLSRHGAKAWVNHPRRSFPFYRALKARLMDAKQISYQVQGGAWGLACNGLHFLDHLAYLSGADALEVCGEGLNRHIVPSKRPGFVEFTGALSGRLGLHAFELFCHEDASPMTITICSDRLNAVLDETNGWIRMASADSGWQWHDSKEKIVLFQSELTQLVVKDILMTGHCDLPTFAEAVRLHVPFIQCLMAHMGGVHGHSVDVCPIT